MLIIIPILQIRKIGSTALSYLSRNMLLLVVEKSKLNSANYNSKTYALFTNAFYGVINYAPFLMLLEQNSNVIDTVVRCNGDIIFQKQISQFFIISIVNILPLIP